MAKTTQKTAEIETLIRRSEVARLQLGLAHREFKRKLDVSTRLKNSVKKEPTKWLSGGVLTGMIGGFLFRKKKDSHPAMRPSRIAATGSASLGKDAIWMRTLQVLVRIGKPAVKFYIGKMIKDYIEKKSVLGHKF